MGGTPLVSGVTAWPRPTTGPATGWWPRDGGIFTFGDAPFFGSIGGAVLSDPVVGMAAMPDDGGYYMVGQRRRRLHLRRRRRSGAPSGAASDGNPHVILPIAGHRLGPGRRRVLAARPRRVQLHVHQSARPDAVPVGLGHRGHRGRARSTPTPTPVTSATRTGRARSGARCSPPGCGSRPGCPSRPTPSPGTSTPGPRPIPACCRRAATPSAGDAVLYGTGPWSTSSSLHVGLVVQVWPDGAVVTVEGDAGPAPTGSLAVVINGPYLPSQSAELQRHADLCLRPALSRAASSSGRPPPTTPPCWSTCWRLGRW